MPDSLSDVYALVLVIVEALIVAAGLVIGGRKAIETVWPIFRPPLQAMRDRVLRDVLSRLGLLERRVDIVEAIQQHTSERE